MGISQDTMYACIKVLRMTIANMAALWGNLKQLHYMKTPIMHLSIFSSRCVGV